MAHSPRDWKQTLEKLNAKQFLTDEIGHAIVKLGKPFDEKRIREAKSVVATYLSHPNAWVRHEAMWFLGSWGKLQEYKPALIAALQNDPDADNRGFAALCLGTLCAKSKDRDSVAALTGAILNENEDDLVRLSAYGALLGVWGKKGGVYFQSYQKGLSEIDWQWVRSLAPG